VSTLGPGPPFAVRWMTAQVKGSVNTPTAPSGRNSPLPFSEGWPCTCEKHNENSKACNNSVSSRMHKAQKAHDQTAADPH
jgi:hypothetical protein